MTTVRWNQTRRWLGRGLLVTSPALALVLHSGVAEACSCIASTVESSYNASSDVISAVPLFGYCTASEQHYIARVTASFKGCAGPDELAILTTPGDSAACGAELEIGTEYLINADHTGSFFGVPRLSFNLCGYNLPTADLSPHDQTFLDGRTVCCGGECQCVDGTQPVLCFANPCEVTAACDEAARCEANYCGGCNAEFYDEAGNAACLEEAGASP